MTFNTCKRVISYTEIYIDLFDVDTSTGVHITREGELCIKASLLFKNLYLIQKKPKLLLHLLCHPQFPSAQEVFLLCRHIELEVSLVV